MYHVLVLRGSTYGYSRDLAAATAALERGKKRGVKGAELEMRKSAVRGLAPNQWLPPFNAPGQW